MPTNMAFTFFIGNHTILSFIWDLREWVFQKAEIAQATSVRAIPAFWKTHKCKLIAKGRYLVYKYTFRQIHHITAIRSNTPIRHCSIFFLWAIPPWPLICSLFTLSLHFSKRLLPRLTSQTDSAHSPCNSAVNHNGAYFSNFKNSQKTEEKSYDYNFSTNVIRTKKDIFGG